MATVNVTLSVDTQNVTTTNTDDTSICNFGQSSGSDEDYTTVVNVGDIVVWNGVSSNAPSTDTVSITGIVDTGGPNVFTNLTSSANPPYTITGNVEAGTVNPPGDDETYTISFQVFNNGVLRGSYQIDPKIKVNP